MKMFITSTLKMQLMIMIIIDKQETPMSKYVDSLMNGTGSSLLRKDGNFITF
jgi:hypothetical protein